MSIGKEIKLSVARFFGIEKPVMGVRAMVKRLLAKPVSTDSIAAPSIVVDAVQAIAQPSTINPVSVLPLKAESNPRSAAIDRLQAAVEAERNRVREIMRVGFELGCPRIAAALIEQGVKKNTAIRVLQSMEFDTQKCFYQPRRSAP